MLAVEGDSGGPGCRYPLHPRLQVYILMSPSTAGVCSRADACSTKDRAAQSRDS